MHVQTTSFLFFMYFFFVLAVVQRRKCNHELLELTKAVVGEAITALETLQRSELNLND